MRKSGLSVVGTNDRAYKIIRMFFGDKGNYTIETGLTLAEAQAHCQNSETSSSTAKSAKATRYTERNGAWFDGYTLMDGWTDKAVN